MAKPSKAATKKAPVAAKKAVATKAATKKAPVAAKNKIEQLSGLPVKEAFTPDNFATKAIQVRLFIKKRMLNAKQSGRSVLNLIQKSAATKDYKDLNLAFEKFTSELKGTNQALVNQIFTPAAPEKK